MSESSLVRIIAFNINTGGARALLNILINRIRDINAPAVIYVKDRSVIDNSGVHDTVVQLKFRNYLTGFLLLFQKRSSSLFFGNWPPFRKCDNSILYIHNEYLVNSAKEILSQKMPIANKLKFIIQIFSIHLFHNNVTQIAVQTGHIAEALTRKLKREVLILPFFDDKPRQGDQVLKTFEFCFVGLPSQHKNHKLLLAAIRKLYQERVTFSVAMTIPEVKANSDLLSEIRSINGISGGKIINFGLCDSIAVHDIYSKSRALIFPSQKESLGLPVIEALQQGLVILSADREYSYELVNNPITFDPLIPDQMADIMKDFINGKLSSIPQTLKIKSHLGTIINMLLT